MKLAKPLLLTPFLGLGVFLMGAGAETSEPSSVAKDDKTLLSTAAPLLPELKPEEQHPQASRSIANLLTQYHYQRPKLDNDMSVKILERYLKLLDNNRSYFLASDVDEFQQYRFTLDNAIYTGWLNPAYEIYDLFRKRWEDRYEFALAQLDKPFDFSKDEEFRYDREDAAWAKNETELNDIWRKRVKNDALNLILAKKEPDEVKDLLRKRYEAAKRRMSQTKNEDVFWYYMNAYSQSIDPHTNYFSPRAAENFDIEMKLSLQGIGAVLQTDDVYTKVVRLVPEGPADKTGQLSPEDKVIGVGQGNKPIQDVVGWRLDDVVDLIRGDAGTTVRLEIIPQKAGIDGEPKVISIVRDTVKLEEQAAKAEVIEFEQGEQTYKVGVIDLPKFYVDFQAKYSGEKDYRSTTRDVRLLLKDLKKQGVDGVVLDLRNNGGGALDEATELTGLFIDKGPVVQDRNRLGRVRVLGDEDPGVEWSGPLAVLVNRGSASASEIVAGAIQDYGRGVIIGEQTFGKGTIQSIFDLNRLTSSDEFRFGQLKQTIGKFYRVNGESTQHKGVVPDIEFPSAFSREEFSESAYDNALPWDTIKAVTYEKLNQVDPFVDILRQRHSTRVEKNPEFQYLLADIKDYEEKREKKTVSLNIEERKAQRIEERQKQLARENERRARKGQKPLASFDELEALTEEESAEASVEDEQIELEEDYQLQEAGRILADFILLQHKSKMAQASSPN